MWAALFWITCWICCRNIATSCYRPTRQQPVLHWSIGKIDPCLSGVREHESTNAACICRRRGEGSCLELAVNIVVAYQLSPGSARVRWPCVIGMLHRKYFGIQCLLQRCRCSRNNSTDNFRLMTRGNPPPLIYDVYSSTILRSIERILKLMIALCSALRAQP